MNEKIRSQFRATETHAYLNSAAVSPLPQKAIDAVLSQLNDVAAHGADHYPAWVETKERCRALIAGMLNVRSEQIAFMRNTSDGFASIANGIDWREGDNIVSFAGEFPANFYPWRMARDRYGVELRLVEEREGRIDLDEMAGMIDARTRLVSISSVQFASGFRADLGKLADAAHSYDALFAVDIIQGFGAHAYDLSALGVDLAAGASHKWLCAPEGCGIIYVSDRAREMIEPALVGWISVEHPWHFDDREQPFKPNALGWESGTGPSSLFYGLEQSLLLLNETGLDRIESYLQGLSDRLCDGLSSMDYDIISSRRAGEASAIVCIKHRRGLESADIAKHLHEQQVVVSPRGDRLRIAPHFYNNEEDIDRLLESLPD
ncbi:MAG TPA: aminotransferase class V-fold PLP-dependent enzyme [Pyrinomonadaceae bacterium]|nr:aminotransferase class V-fold PLP-dependent enzyme [Pyrinomonadaceae bacterium]